jgi:hypothetical protein
MFVDGLRIVVIAAGGRERESGNQENRHAPDILQNAAVEIPSKYASDFFACATRVQPVVTPPKFVSIQNPITSLEPPPAFWDFHRDAFRFSARSCAIVGTAAPLVFVFAGVKPRCARIRAAESSGYCCGRCRAPAGATPNFFSSRCVCSRERGLPAFLRSDRICFTVIFAFLKSPGVAFCDNLGTPRPKSQDFLWQIVTDCAKPLVTVVCKRKNPNKFVLESCLKMRTRSKASRLGS